MNNNLQISVIVATRNRASSLAGLLTDLTKQTGAPSFEVIVSDNGCGDDTARAVREITSCLTIQYFRVDLPGKSRALNAAIQLARGDLVVFTDDDVRPRPDWLAQLYDASCKFSEFNIFGGRVEVDENAVPRWILKSFNLMGPLTSAHDLSADAVPYGYGAYPYGPNMAIRRHLIERIPNPFPVHIGPGTSQPVGDESFFFAQFSPPHYHDRLFVPSASVYHEIAPGNVSFLPAIKRCFLLGRCHAWLALPPVVRKPGQPESVFQTSLSRLKKCSSILEFFCLSARFIGYRQGQLELHAGRLPGMVSRL